ncbi:MAG: S1/P1 nuclease [Betaproteobacteria bacterium]
MIALLLITVTLPAWSWNAAGHRLIAFIAWQQLSPPARQAIINTLNRHPEYDRWVTAAHDADTGRASFTEASTWPDDIRGDTRFFNQAHEDPTPLLPGFTTMARHREWHYIDLPLDRGQREGEGELDRRLLQLVDRLKARQISPTEEPETLAWVIHLVGDIHQPLHVGSNHDEGGNGHAIEDPTNLRRPTTNLHRWWDDRPGPPWLRGSPLHQAANRLLSQHRAPQQGDIALWRDESWQLALVHAYPPAGSITPAFASQARAVTERQLVAAGIRLGRLLEKIYGEVSRETGSQ